VATLVALADIAHGNVLITGSYGANLDTFNRTVVSGVGSDQLGQAWTAAGGTTNDFGVPGNGTMVIHVSAVGSTRQVRSANTYTDMDARTTFASDKLATGAYQGYAHMMRWFDANNYYFAEVRFFPDQTVDVAIVQRLGSIETDLVALDAGIVHVANQYYELHTQIAGNVLRASAWVPGNGNVEPPWTAQAPVTALAGNKIWGVRGVLAGGNTNTLPVTFTVMNLQAVEILGAGGAVLLRQTPDGTQTQVRGTPVNVVDGTLVAWDDEAPQGVPVFYVTGTQLLAGLTVTGTATSNTVTITGTGDVGWLKDPTQPALDIQLDFPQRSEGPCDTDLGVTLSTLGDDAFPDADGEFPAVNRARPRVITMTRKASQSQAVFISQQQADFTRVRQLLATGRTTLWQLPTTYGWALDTYGSDYVHVRDATSARMPSQDMRHTQREWSLPYALVDPPPNLPYLLTGSNGIGGGRATWDQMKVSGLTYAALKATNKTYAQLAQGQGY
jgi:hypothetical protein